MQALQVVLALVFVAFWVGLFAALVWRVKKRHSTGPAAVGAVYDMLNEDKRNAVELIVEQRTGDRDPERARDKDPDLDPAGSQP